MKWKSIIVDGTECFMETPLEGTRIPPVNLRKKRNHTFRNRWNSENGDMNNKDCKNKHIIIQDTVLYRMEFIMRNLEGKKYKWDWTTRQRRCNSPVSMKWSSELRVTPALNDDKTQCIASQSRFRHLWQFTEP